MLLYYAHPISMYGSAEELRAIEVMEARGHQVLNPSHPRVAEAFEAYRATHQENYMEFFFALCNLCDGFAFSTFPDDVLAEGVPQVPRRVGAGIVGEGDTFFDSNAPGYWLNFSTPGIYRFVPVSAGWSGFTLLDVSQTRAMLKVLGRGTSGAARGWLPDEAWFNALA